MEFRQRPHRFRSLGHLACEVGIELRLPESTEVTKFSVNTEWDDYGHREAA